MTIIGLIAAGIIPTIFAKLFMPAHDVFRLLILGLSGAGIAAVMQYAQWQPIGFFFPLFGAIALLVLYAFTAQHPTEERSNREDFRKAA